MVRSKRLRKLKLQMITAAGIFALAAVFLVFTIFIYRSGILNTGKKEVSAAVSVETVEVTPDDKNGIQTLADSTDYTAVVSQDSAEKEADASDDTDPADAVMLPEGIQDDSDQDSHSAVAEQMQSEAENAERVYLTFDDGPSIYTDKILDILSENGVHATFFVCGTGDRDERLRHTYKRIVDEGHTIGMHSYSHVYSEVYRDLDSFQYDLDKIRNLIYNETGIAPKFYRFPGGSGNTVAGLPMDRYISVLYSQNMEYYDWNVYCGDSSGRALSSGEIVQNTLRGVDKWKSSVVLLHDTGGKKSTVDALPAILKGLKARGLEILPIDQDTPPLHQYKTQPEE